MRPASLRACPGGARQRPAAKQFVALKCPRPHLRDQPGGSPESIIMLTPAEELGLSGLGLASRVRKAFFRIPESRLIALTERLRAEAKRRHLCYLRDGQE